MNHVPKSSKNVPFSSFSNVFTKGFQIAPVRVPFSNSGVFETLQAKMCCYRVNGRPISNKFMLLSNCVGIV